MGGISEALLESSELFKRLRRFNVTYGLQHGYVLESRGGGGIKTVAGSDLDSRSRMHGL